MSEPGFDVAVLEAEVATRGLALGRTVSWSADTTSTNDDALAAAKSGAPHGALFGAETQSRGRGRRGSEWLSAPGAGLWFSLLLRPELRAELAPGLALCAGLAVRSAVASRVAAPALVKWPNDVLAGGKKLAGVLVESQFTGAQVASVVVGIGINVEQEQFPEPIASLATSLRQLGAAERGRERLLADVLEAFERELSRIGTHGMPAIAEALRPHDALFGRRLRVGDVEGEGAGIDASGALLVRRKANDVTAVVSGHVELL
ncbi:MAG: biotin--[acetyl-CoA-carboxylase] ligase [Myxococcales bacterium]|nr:MAG: biotin--[acetyl-CoA-carboxylase] ligase [Myxococcales bacterium]